MEDFHRIRRLPPYVFEQVNRAKAAARNAGADIVDLGMGNPDLPAPAHVIEKLKETVGRPRTDRYSSSKGIPGLRRAQAAYYARRFGVELDPEREVIVTLGSKEGLANLAQAITAPGDIILVPNPTYPIHSFGFIIAGASVQHVPIGPDIDFMRELKKAAASSVLTFACVAGTAGRRAMPPSRSVPSCGHVRERMWRNAFVTVGRTPLLRLALLRRCISGSRVSYPIRSTASHYFDGIASCPSRTPKFWPISSRTS